MGFSFSFNPNDHASTDIQLHRNISASLLSNDLTVIEKWGKDNLVSFNQSKTKQAVISRKRKKEGKTDEEMGRKCHTVDRIEAGRGGQTWEDREGWRSLADRSSVAPQRQPP